MMRLRFYIAFLILVGCSSPPKVILHYDRYKGNRISQSDAVKITYEPTDTPDIRMVKIESSLNNARLIFREKETDTGILRSIGGSEFHLTHSFGSKQNIISGFPESAPVFFNAWAQNRSSKKYAIGNMDSLEIISFGEGITDNSVTVTYFNRRSGIFILFYDPEKDTYLKIVKIEGSIKSDAKSVLKTVDRIVLDTSFFYRFFKDKLLHVPPPSLEN